MNNLDQPAFPYALELQEPGLTKREWFLGIILQGYVSAGSTGMPSPKQLVEYAIETTDALIEALNKGGQP